MKPAQNYHLEPSDVVSIHVNPEQKKVHTHRFLEMNNQFSSFDMEICAVRSRLWVTDGFPCEILSPKKDWVKGRIKIQFVFEPDEKREPQPKPSPLDDLRQKVDELS